MNHARGGLPRERRRFKRLAEYLPRYSAIWTACSLPKREEDRGWMDDLSLRVENKIVLYMGMCMDIKYEWNEELGDADSQLRQNNRVEK